MALEDTSKIELANPGSEHSTKALAAAISLLNSLRPRILEALGGQPLRIPLTVLDIMKPERNDPARAHILYTGPSEDDLISVNGQRLKNVCRMLTFFSLEKLLLIFVQS